MKPAVDSLLQIFHLSFEMVWFGNALCSDVLLRTWLDCATAMTQRSYLTNDKALDWKQNTANTQQIAHRRLSHSPTPTNKNVITYRHFLLKAKPYCGITHLTPPSFSQWNVPLLRTHNIPDMTIRQIKDLYRPLIHCPFDNSIPAKTTQHKTIPVKYVTPIRQWRPRCIGGMSHLWIHLDTRLTSLCMERVVEGQWVISDHRPWPDLDARAQRLHICLQSIGDFAAVPAVPTCPMLSMSSQSCPSRSAALSSRNTQRGGMPLPPLRLGSPWRTQGGY